MGPRCGPKLAAVGDPRLRDLERRHCEPPRSLWALGRVVVALNVGLLAVLVASLDPALIAMAGGLAANVIIMLSQGWIGPAVGGKSRSAAYARAYSPLKVVTNGAYRCSDRGRDYGRVCRGVCTLHRRAMRVAVRNGPFVAGC
jgi:hypothetical protein